MYDINILPPKLRKKKKKVSVKVGNPTYAPFLLLGVIVTATILNFQLESKMEDLDTETKKISEEVTIANTKVQEVQRLAEEVKGLKERLTAEEETVFLETFKWDLMLDEISATVPPEVTITHIKQINKTQVEVKAETYTLTNMARTKESFEQSKYFHYVEMTALEQNHTNLISRPLEVEFTIVATYSPDPNKVPEPVSNPLEDRLNGGSNTGGPNGNPWSNPNGMTPSGTPNETTPSGANNSNPNPSVTPNSVPNGSNGSSTVPNQNGQNPAETLPLENGTETGSSN